RRRGDRMKRRAMAASLIVLLAVASPAFADDEIQIYNAQIAAVGQWTFQQHLNYTFSGRKEPDFPGGLVPNHALNGTPEFAYGMTVWWEVGFDIPFAVSSGGAFLSNGFAVCSPCRTPASETFSTASISSSATRPRHFRKRVLRPKSVRSSECATRNGSSSSIRLSISVSARSARLTSCPRQGWRATSATTALSASNITLS